MSSIQPLCCQSRQTAFRCADCVRSGVKVQFRVCNSAVSRVSRPIRLLPDAGERNAKRLKLSRESGDAQGLRAGQLVHRRHARERGRADGFADNSGRGIPRWMREAARLTESTAHNVRYVNPPPHQEGRRRCRRARPQEVPRALNGHSVQTSPRRPAR